MPLSLNKPKLDNLAGDIWKSAQWLRGKFKAYEYQSVIMPIIVIRRLECVLLAWRGAKRAEVLAKRPKLTGKALDKLVKELELNPQQSPFSNKTDWTLRKVYEEDPTLLEENFREYINGFSKNVDDIIEHFNYRATIGTMVKNNRLAPILNQYKELDLGPDQLSGLEMGYIYEELLRRFSEQSGEEAGDHFTPREVIRLMVELLEIPIPDRHISIYDPACGTGGMLSVAKEHLLDRAASPAEKERVEKYVTVHGQELSPIRPRLSTVSGPFLAWLHSCKSFRAQYEAKAVGVTRFGLPEYAFRAARVPLPPLPEQQRIAAYLDATCAAIDGAVAAKRRQIETLDALRKTTITRAVTRGLEDDVKLESTGNVWMTSVPRWWSLVCLKRISDIQTGLTLGKTYEGPLIERPYLRVANVQDGHLDLDDVTPIEVPSAVAARVELRAGDVLMTEGGDLDKLGRGYLWNGQIPNCLHQNHIFAVRCFPHKLRPMFLTYATTSQYGRDYFEATGKRTTNLASTSSTKVGMFPVPLPPLTEQDEICDSLDAKLTELKRIAEGIAAQTETLTAYRKSLIRERVTGQRRVTEEDLHRAGAQTLSVVAEAS